LQLSCRSYSRPLQRAVTDFGADVAFEEARKKMQEHYGLEIPACMIRKITENHARAIGACNLKQVENEANTLIVEMDGSMVPIVELGKKKPGIDLRRTRKVTWKEAKLCFARSQSKVDT